MLIGIYSILSSTFILCIITVDNRWRWDKYGVVYSLKLDCLKCEFGGCEITEQAEATHELCLKWNVHYRAEK